VSFGAPGELIFRSLAQGSALARIKAGRTAFERIPTESFLEKGEVSPDGEWVIILAPATRGRPVVETLAVPLRGGVPIKLCDTCRADWSPDGKTFYLNATLDPRTFAIPLPDGKVLPDLPVGGINALDGALNLPGALTIERGLISSGSDPSTYAFTRTDSQRNLFRIPLN
jgi:hypothetical protein